MVDDVVLDIVTGLGSSATSVLAYFLFKQTRDLKKQSRLAYSPRIVPRFILSDIDNKYHFTCIILVKETPQT